MTRWIVAAALVGLSPVGNAQTRAQPPSDRIVSALQPSLPDVQGDDVASHSPQDDVIGSAKAGKRQDRKVRVIVPSPYGSIVD